MPELPEVHTIIQDLKQANLLGQRIKDAKIYWNRTIGTPSIKEFCSLIKNKQIQEINRRGKYLIFSLSESYFLLIHLRMTGRLQLLNKEEPLSPYTRVVFNLDQGQQLRFYDTRKFGRISLVKSVDEVIKKMGPEPLDPDFALKEFLKSLQKRSRALKALLLDQSFIAGLGNIYVDEALWQAKLHPLKQANRLTEKEAQKLFESIIHVLKKGIANQGTTLGHGKSNYYRLSGERGHHQDLMNVFRRTGLPCPRCEETIIRILVAQRSTHICPFCQKL
jgi:formamidopyrimidine-DNA glycosylase